jgi:hypothetical protein
MQTTLGKLADFCGICLCYAKLAMVYAMWMCDSPYPSAQKISKQNGGLVHGCTFGGNRIA